MLVSSGIAVGAGAVEDDLVLLHPQGDMPRDVADRALELLVAERGDGAAAVADQVVVMAVPLAHGLEANNPLADPSRRATRPSSVSSSSTR